MDQTHIALQMLPGVDSLLNHSLIKQLLIKYRYPFVLKTIRAKLTEERAKILNNETYDTGADALANKIYEHIYSYEKNELKPVINGTGVLLHTNLGRAILGKGLLKDLEKVIGDYTNLEYNLNTGKRGKRKSHINDLIKDLLNVEDSAVVNNNAAAVFLCLNALAFGKEVIVSRGELIEIGDSFRIPDIMKLSGVKMIEVGTTNKTKLKDYEEAINIETAVLFKTHRSNFSLKGFTDDVPVKELAALAKRRNLISMCDIGSGLLFNHKETVLQHELSVEEIIEQGIDLVMFSGDKLVGGPQCGIIAGKKALVAQIENHPLMRTYRVDKLTIIALSSVLKEFLLVAPSESVNPTYNHLIKNNIDGLRQNASRLHNSICADNLHADIVPSKVQVGGGTLPEVYFDSYALEITSPFINGEELFSKLLKLDKPIVSFLKHGKVVIDLFCVHEDDMPYIAQSINNLCKTQ